MMAGRVLNHSHFSKQPHPKATRRYFRSIFMDLPCHTQAPTAPRLPHGLVV
jgi:hypothetical protein